MDPDLELIERFKSGDLGGFEMLVKKYQNKSINLAYSLTQDSSGAQDIAQEAFIKVYENILKFRQESKFSSWLYRIVVNTAYDYLRKNKLLNVSLNDEACPEIIDTKIQEDILAKELVQSSLARIPFVYRSALILKEIEDLSYEEISKTLNVSIGTVESRIYRARQLLKEILIKKGVYKNEM